MGYGNYLWATSRKKWVKKPGKKIKGCIFCGIAREDPDVPAMVIYKDSSVMVIMNIFPYNVGHIEVVPVRHVVNIEDLNEEEFLHFFKTIKKSLGMLRKALEPKGFNIGFNLNESSGASIAHLHAQIVPRYDRDAGFMEVTSDTKVMSESLDQTFKRIKKHAGMLK